MCPKDDSPEEIERARKAYFSMWKNDPTSTVAFFSDPVMLGDYPAEYYEWYKEILPDIREGDLELISQPIDFTVKIFIRGRTFLSIKTATSSGNSFLRGAR